MDTGPLVYLDKLKEIASAATQGCWRLWAMDVRSGPSDDSDFDKSVSVARTFYTNEKGQGRTNDAEHIAAFDPPTVLALIAEIERLRTYGLDEDSTRRHTREPWGSYGERDEVPFTEHVGGMGYTGWPRVVIGSVHNTEPLGHFETLYGHSASANAKRACDCVNALTGIENPIEAVKELKEALDLKDKLQKQLEHYAELVVAAKEAVETGSIEKISDIFKSHGVTA